MLDRSCPMVRRRHSSPMFSSPVQQQDPDCKASKAHGQRKRRFVTQLCQWRRPFLVLILTGLGLDWLYLLSFDRGTEQHRHLSICSGDNNATRPKVQPPPTNDSISTTAITVTPDSVRSRSKLKHDGSVMTSLCQTCFSTTDSKMNLTCSQLIYSGVKDDAPLDRRNQAWIQAAQTTTSAYCRQVCLECPPEKRHYWRLDAAAPQEQASKSHFLSAIPKEYRLPETAVDDLGTYFEDVSVRYPQRTYLFEYNPTIVILPPHQRLDPHAVYLASYRVSNFQYCFKSKANPYLYDFKVNSDHVPSDGLVALLLLRRDLTVIQDIVIDVSGILRMQDPRLFVLHNQLYLASFESIVPFWLQNAPPDMVVLKDYWNKPNGFQVTFRPQPSCCTSPTCAGGKNFNYFVNGDNNSTHALVETNPMNPRIVEQVDLQATCSDIPTSKAVVYQDATPPPLASFATTDQVVLAQYGIPELPYSRERGTACCISVEPQPGIQWLVGISHTKSKRVDGLTQVMTGRQYASRLYAFEPVAPYRVVAMSGAFCMGFPTRMDQKDNYFNRASVQQPFVMGEKLNCPKITFISGLTQAEDDPSKVIISYGINDCTGRMVVVDKSDLVAMLTSPSSRLSAF